MPRFRSPRGKLARPATPRTTPGKRLLRGPIFFRRDRDKTSRARYSSHYTALL